VATALGGLGGVIWTSWKVVSMRALTAADKLRNSLNRNKIVSRNEEGEWGVGWGGIRGTWSKSYGKKSEYGDI
jgi:hypothetical protein